MPHIDKSSTELTAAYNKHKVPFTEAEILARRASGTGNCLSIRCPNHQAHKNGDKNPSGTYYRSIGYYQCHAGNCGIKGFASDRNRGDWRATYRKQVYYYGKNAKGEDLKVIREYEGVDSPSETGKTVRTHGGTKEGPWPPYNIDALQADPQILFICEGEQCVDALGDHHALLSCDGAAVSGTNIVCIGSRGGSNAAEKTDWSMVKQHLDAHPMCALVYLPDCDESGAAYMRDVDRLLGRPDRAQIIDLSPYDDGTTIGYDVKDYLDQGYNFGDLKAKLYERPRAYRLEYLEDVQAESVQWVINQHLPAGKLAILFGDPASGKTMIAIDLIAALSTGRAWNGIPTTKMKTLALFGEDDLADAVVPNLKSAGADLTQVRAMRAEDFHGAPVQIEQLERDIVSGGFGFVMLDPIVLLSSSVKSSGYNPVEYRQALTPLKEIASRTGCTILGIAHMTKGSSDQPALERLQGSSVWGQLARMVWGIQLSQDDEGARQLVRVKSSYGPTGDGFKFRIERDPDSAHKAGRVFWEGDVEGSVDELMAKPKPPAGQKVREMGDQVMEALADGKIKTLGDIAAHAQVNTNSRTLRRALKALQDERCIEKPGHGSYLMVKKVAK